MSMSLSCSAAASGRAGIHCGRVTVSLLILPIVAVCGACGGEKVDAKFHLTAGPVMVFVDDVHERVDWPPARRYLWEDVSQELLRTESATKVVPIETEESLRQTRPDFVKLTCREIGELAGAEQVVWIEVQDFLAEEDITDATNAAYFAVTVKVLNATEKTDRHRVRVWPDSPEGHYLSANMTGAGVVGAKTKDGISKFLTAKVAVSVARLFHDHQLEDFEHAP
jgi:hypothetical protein